MYGFGTIGVVIGTLNFGLMITTLMTVKGIYIPAWVIVVISGLVIICCTATGYYFEKYAIWKRTISHQNQNVNPELLKLLNDMELIKKKIGIYE
jgi:hypothetical protein